MEFIVVIVTLIGFAITVDSGKDRCEITNDIVDIYYAPGQRHLSYHKKCRYTLTPRKCDICMTKYIPRNDYDHHKEQYEKKNNTAYPFLKRFDLRRVYDFKKTK